MEVKLKTLIKIFVVVICSTVFLLIFTGVSCTITPEGISILDGNFESPKFLELNVLSEKEINLLFSTDIKIENLKIETFPVSQLVNIESKNLGEGSWQIITTETFDCTKTYVIEGYVLDARKNSLYFKDSFVGFNNRIPKVVINEIRTEYSKPKVEFIELKVLSDGNLGGMELITASDGSENSYVIPSVEVKSGDYVVIHYRNIEDGCIDELENDKELSTATESSSSRDLWIENSSARIAKSDVIILKERIQGNIADGIIFTESSFSAWKTDYMAECAEVLISSEAWSGESVISDGLTTTRTLSRQNLNKDKSAWIVVGTSKATPGKENSSVVYVAK